MPLETFLALIVYAFTTSITPGPNNMMLLSSGVNFGLRRTIPHMVGIELGICEPADRRGLRARCLVPVPPRSIYLALKIAGRLYLLWIAWSIGTSRSLGDGKSTGRPMTLIAAAAFQWVNPKAWVMALVAMGAYTNADHPVLSVVLVGVAFAVVNFPSVSVWAGFGVALRGYLADPRRLRVFNGLMGLALLLSIVPILF